VGAPEGEFVRVVLAYELPGAVATPGAIRRRS